MSQQLLRTSRYYMPPRITRNSHRPSGYQWLESQIEPWLAVLKLTTATTIQHRAQTKAREKAVNKRRAD